MVYFGILFFENGCAFEIIYLLLCTKLIYVVAFSAYDISGNKNVFFLLFFFQLFPC